VKRESEEKAARMKRESEEKAAQIKQESEQRRREAEEKESTRAELRQIHQSMSENFRRLFDADSVTKERLTVVEDKHTELEKTIHTVESHHAQLAWKIDRLEARTEMNEATLSKHDHDIDSTEG
jgi:arsenate reductase-like glutaredoxin family protein